MERGQWRSPRHPENLREQYATAAKAAIKDQRINIRVSQQVLDRLRDRAHEEGLPYQTLIASVLHKYVNGRLVDAPRSH